MTTRGSSPAASTGCSSSTSGTTSATASGTVEKLRAALRPEGRVLVVDRDADSPHAPPVDLRISVETVIGELEAAGFSARVLPQALPRQFMVEGTVRSATPPE